MLKMKPKFNFVDFYYPRSFFKLILLGFVLVSLPLIFAFTNAALDVDRLATLSQKAVYQAAQAARGSRLLMEQTLAMERVFRQYLILNDATLLDDYTHLRQNFKQTTSQLSLLPLDESQLSELNKLIEKEQNVFDSLSAPVRRKPAEIVDEFILLSDLAQSVLTESNALIDREVEYMQQTAARAQRTLLWQVLASIPLALLIAGMFTVLISRPIRQLDSAIRRLGAAEFSTGIKVSGPQDLQHLGERLDWLRERLAELEEQKSKFLRQVSHELKTPLTAIREGSELLSDQIGGTLNVQQQEIAGIVKQNSVQLQKLIENLLNYHQSKHFGAVLTLQPVHVKAVIERVAAEQKLALLARELKLNLELGDIMVDGDEEKIRIIVDNLLTNAIKYSPVAATIHMSLAVKGEFAEIDVVDGGPGILAADRDKIFDSFYQGQIPPEGRIKGTGLGLAIAKEYVNAHRGSIMLMDSAQGAHFRVNLPLKASVENQN